MLQQANALDERESFSSLRRLAWQNGHYFTLRTTFNQPGHLATVVAFDLPINDLIPPGMPLDSFRLEPDTTPASARNADKESPDSVSISFNSSKIEISSALNSTGMRLVWQVPFGTLLLDTLQNILLPLLLNIGCWRSPCSAIPPSATSRDAQRKSRPIPQLIMSYGFCARLTKRLSPYCRWVCWCMIKKRTAR